MAKDSIGSLFGIADPKTQQNKLQRYLGEFEEVDSEVTLGVEIEWETETDRLDMLITSLRDEQPGLTVELIQQWYPGHRINPDTDHLQRMKNQISNRLVVYHEEASLVNGLEMVLGPANSRLMRLLVESVLMSSAGRVDASDRCSTHVHMNVCDLTMKQLGVMTLLYPFIEELLFKWVDPQRWHNPFTRPWCTDSQYRAEPRKYQAMNIVPSGCRLDSPYGELHLSDVGRHTIGTIEFRHFPGLSPRNLLLFFQWLDFIEEFRAVCLAQTREKIIETFQPLASTSGYVEVLRQMFPLSSGHWLKMFGHNEVQSFMVNPVAAFRRAMGKDSASSAYREEFSLRTVHVSELAKRLPNMVPTKKVLSTDGSFFASSVPAGSIRMTEGRTPAQINEMILQMEVRERELAAAQQFTIIDEVAPAPRVAVPRTGRTTTRSPTTRRR